MALVEKGVLPEECLQPHIAPAIISAKRRVEKEQLKDLLRGWIALWGETEVGEES